MCPVTDYVFPGKGGHVHTTYRRKKDSHQDMLGYNTTACHIYYLQPELQFR